MPVPTPTTGSSLLDQPPPLNSPFRVTLAENGQALTYHVTGRFGVFLDQDQYPANEYTCLPAGIISWVSNATGLYDADTGLHSVGFEGVQPGTCVLRNEDFSVTIHIVE